MEVAIFNKVTTESILAELEAEGLSYEGLYVDMSDPKQRKYCKDKGEVIQKLRKDLNRARIDLTKVSKANIDNEHAAIDARLAKANEPFDLLINDWKAERAKVFSRRKAHYRTQGDARAKRMRSRNGITY